MNFNLKKPCANCPFLKEGAIELQPGRVEGIVESLLENDREWFMCHKTVHHPKHGGDWVEDEEGEEVYKTSGNESQCVGSMVYLHKAGRPSLSMRMAAVYKMLDPEDLEAQADKIIDVFPQETPRKSKRTRSQACPTDIKSSHREIDTE